MKKPPPRVVFLHIPKCGGTSINHHFKSNFGGKRTKRSVLLDSVVGNISQPHVIKQAQAAQYVSGHFGWDTLARVRGDAITFTILRDPFDRLQALYAFARKPRRIAHPAFAKLAEAGNRMSFAEFCLDDAADLRAMTDNAIARTLASDYFPHPVEASADVAAACRNLDELHFVTDVTRLGEALPRIAAATQTKIVRGATWLNRTRMPSIAAMRRADFLADPDLRTRIEQDLAVYEHAQAGMC